MKKFMAFVCGLCVGILPLFCGKAKAVQPSVMPTGACETVFNKLSRLALSERLMDVDLSDSTREFDKLNGLRDKSFGEVLACYTRSLEELFQAHRPILLGCRALASYAFTKHREAGIDCQYLKIDDAESGAHAVVLVPQSKEGKTDWYVCDFTRAVFTQDVSWLFVPLTDYMTFYHTQAAPLKCLTICDSTSARFFGTKDYWDLRLWFADVKRDVQAATDVMRWEVNNGVLLSLAFKESFGSYIVQCIKMANLCKGVSEERSQKWIGAVAELSGAGF